MTVKNSSKIVRYRGFVVAPNADFVGDFDIYTNEEYAYGKGFRYPEMEGVGTIEIAKEWIDSYHNDKKGKGTMQNPNIPKPIAVSRATKFARGAAYWALSDALKIVKLVSKQFPEARPVNYEKGWAVQTETSGDYLDKNLEPTGKGSAMQNPSAFDAIRAGDRITIVDRFGQERAGRAVMYNRQYDSWVLNMGGAHGKTAIATRENVVKISPKKNDSMRGYKHNPAKGKGSAARNPNLHFEVVKKFSTPNPKFTEGKGSAARNPETFKLGSREQGVLKQIVRDIVDANNRLVIANKAITKMLKVTSTTNKEIGSARDELEAAVYSAKSATNDMSELIYSLYD